MQRATVIAVVLILLVLVALSGYLASRYMPGAPLYVTDAPGSSTGAPKPKTSIFPLSWTQAADPKEIRASLRMHLSNGWLAEAIVEGPTTNGIVIPHRQAKDLIERAIVEAPRPDLAQVRVKELLEERGCKLVALSIYA